MRSFNEYLNRYLEDLKQKQLYRNMEVLKSGCHRIVHIGKRSFINFCSNNYLGLNGHSDIRKAMIESIAKWGTSSGASRLISGDLELFEIAEKKLAKFKGLEASLIFPSGYQANVSIISSLVGEGDIVFSDELNHASIIDGCRLSKARIIIYKHRDFFDLKKKLESEIGKRRLIVTDSVFSMDGDIANIKELVDIAERYDCALLIDDAHATGILGKNGSGSLEHYGIKGRDVMVLATGGKALGVSGAFFCSSDIVRKYLINRCRGFIYSTGAIPAIPAGLMASIEVVKKEGWRRERLKSLYTYFWRGLKDLGLSTSEEPSHILPLILGDSEKAIRVSKKLYEKGIYARAIRPPTVPENSSRIRFCITAEHNYEDIEIVLQILKKNLDYILN
ncbi:MAG: 8-amino-7-oxononanoate synthase [Proteobacteria bacterium]|nr:8-amino-7-oxononanoate synthase [Pseudomonadota bacterium]